jgi:hypothetical protein
MSEQFTYRHYLIADTTPIVVKVDAQGREVSAHWPDPETGQLEWATELLSAKDLGDETVQISKAEFERLCNTIFETAIPLKNPSGLSARSDEQWRESWRRAQAQEQAIQDWLDAKILKKT